MQAINTIIIWLKTNGRSANNGTTYSVHCKDEPFMEFSAEWQQWSDHELLFVGYQTKMNGDICNDPQYCFRIKDDAVYRVTYDNWMIGSYLLVDDDDIQYAFSFADMTYHRHLRDRTQLLEASASRGSTDEE